MPYPFAPTPTFQEFLDKARTLGVEEATVDGIRYLRRGDGAIVFPPDMQQEELVQPVVLSNWCRVLDLSPEKFGFDAGFLQDPLGAWEWE